MSDVYRPILFKDELVLSILQGRKTETRRIIDPRKKKCPYGEPGDRLWVRHAFRKAPSTKLGYLYRFWEEYPEDWKWTPGIHMPFDAHQLELEVLEIRRERVQDITKEGALAEGCPFLLRVETYPWSPRLWFKEKWNEINDTPKRRYGWDLNPEVWVVKFKLHRIPMDWKILPAHLYRRAQA